MATGPAAATLCGTVAVCAAMSAGAEPFTPVQITTEKLTITGTPSTMQTLPFVPVRITTEQLTITGIPGTFQRQPFSPVRITTEKLTITGQQP